MRFNLNLNKEREFAIAYRLFSQLGETPISASKCAVKYNVSKSVMTYILKRMKGFGLAVTKLGNGVGGTYKVPGTTIADLFQKYEFPFQEGEEFEKRLDAIIARYSRDKKCIVCSKYCPEVSETGCCKGCKALGSSILSSKRLARCGHYSLTRYFKCEGCLPVLEDNATPDDWGVGLIT